MRFFRLILVVLSFQALVALILIPKSLFAEQDKTYGVYNIDAVAKGLPPDEGESLVTDNRLVDRPDAGVRVFRVNKEVPKHYHNKSDTYLYVISGKARFVIADEKPITVSTGNFIFYPRGTKHGVVEIIEKPLVFLAFDVPARDPEDAVFEVEATDKFIETK